MIGTAIAARPTKNSGARKAIGYRTRIIRSRCPR
jgi:hypothetical protein